MIVNIDVGRLAAIGALDELAAHLSA